jgi:hypothetical protein
MNNKIMLAVVGLGFSATVATLAAGRDQGAPVTPPVAEKAVETEVVSEPAKTEIKQVEKKTIVAAEAKPRALEVPSTLPEKKPELTPGSEQDLVLTQPAVNAPQLDALIAPIALYPDQLLQQILMASTYPLEVIEAARWISRPENEGLKGDALMAALEDKDWDPSVKAMTAFPQILKMMDSDLDWLAKVGDAFLVQQAAVMDSVQRLRHEARDADMLRSDERRQVLIEDDAITISSANPGVVYVPFYDPTVAYGVWPYPDYPPVYIPPPPSFAYSPGIYYSYISVNHFWGWSRWDWRHRHIRIIDPPRYAHHNRGRWPIDRDVWSHDSSRRHGDRNYQDRHDRHDRQRPRPRPSDPRRDIVDAPPAQSIAPRHRTFQAQPGALPDMSPPLPASARLPDVAPVISNPSIGVQEPYTQPRRTPDRAETMRPRREGQNEQYRQQQRRLQEAREDDGRRQRQFQDRSISAPPIGVTQPMQQPAPRDQSPRGQFQRPMPAAIAPSVAPEPPVAIPQPARIAPQQAPYRRVVPAPTHQPALAPVSPPAPMVSQQPYRRVVPAPQPMAAPAPQQVAPALSQPEQQQPRPFRRVVPAHDRP